jgi:hypothetical protein
MFHWMTLNQPLSQFNRQNRKLTNVVRPVNLLPINRFFAIGVASRESALRGIIKNQGEDNASFKR